MEMGRDQPVWKANEVAEGRMCAPFPAWLLRSAATMFCCLFVFGPSSWKDKSSAEAPLGRRHGGDRVFVARVCSLQPVV